MCELRANELRIGNLVYHNHSIGMKLPAELTTGRDIDMFEEFEPIKLTEEWLINLGFVNNELKAEHNLFVWYENHIGIKGMLGIVKPCKCIYVHQLQNLYFDLTGKELTHQKIN